MRWWANGMWRKYNWRWWRGGSKTGRSTIHQLNSTSTQSGGGGFQPTTKRKPLWHPIGMDVQPTCHRHHLLNATYHPLAQSNWIVRREIHNASWCGNAAVPFGIMVVAEGERTEEQQPIGLWVSSGDGITGWGIKKTVKLLCCSIFRNSANCTENWEGDYF